MAKTLANDAGLAVVISAESRTFLCPLSYYHSASNRVCHELGVGGLNRSVLSRPGLDSERFREVVSDSRDAAQIPIYTVGMVHPGYHIPAYTYPGSHIPGKIEAKFTPKSEKSLKYFSIPP